MSKLILAIIFNADAADPLSQALLEHEYSVTKISSMGGFLRRHNTTFVIGVACPLCLSLDAVNIALWQTMPVPMNAT